MFKTPDTKLNLQPKDKSKVTTYTISEETARKISHYKDKSHKEIYERIQVLQSEWTIDRWFDMHSSCLPASGVHFIHGGYCPPFPISRNQRFRSRHEIDDEIRGMQSLCDETLDSDEED